MSNTYYAKSSSFDGTPVLNKTHLLDVASLCYEYGKPFHMEMVMQKLGVLHDVIKYGDLFQGVLFRGITKVDHAIPAVTVLLYLLHKKGDRKESDVIRMMCEVIGSHHSALIPYGTLRSEAGAILKGIKEFCITGKRPGVSGMEAVEEIVKRFLVDFPDFSLDGLPQISYGKGYRDKFYSMQQTRFGGSILTDADFSMSAYRDSGNKSDYEEGLAITPEIWYKALVIYRDGIRRGSNANPVLNGFRDSVFEDCKRAGRDLSENMWTLTAGTGLGKSMSMQAFAYERCIADKTKERIILVIPYLTISTQMEEDLSHVTSDFLVDNSQTVHEDVERIMSERWTTPFVLTTSVNFFGSLFSAHRGDLRKIHRIANSVICLDENQTIPFYLSRLCLMMLQMLVKYYNCTVVLSSATQPSYQYIPDLHFTAREIITDPKSLFEKTKRAGMKFRKGKVSLDDIAVEAAAYDNVCVITNLRRHARAVYDKWVADGVEHAYLISSDICPADRKHIIQEIKQLQKDGKCVHVSATQCVEAGVDLDFCKIYSALAPLTSLMQRLGRMNRNGRFAYDDMIVFEPETENHRSSYPGEDYEWQASIVRTMVQEGYDVDSLEGIEEYSRRLFQAYKEPDALVQAVNSRDFEAFEKESRFIRQAGVTVVVPGKYCLDDFETFREKVLSGSVKKSDLGITSRLGVQVYDKSAVRNHCVEAVIHNYKTDFDAHTNIWVLMEGHERDCYTSEGGLRLGDVDSIL